MLVFKTIVKPNEFMEFGIEDFIEKAPEYLAIPEDIRKNYNLADIETNSSDLTVDWAMEIDSRDWGVRGFSVTVKRVHGSLFVKLVGEEDLNIRDHEFEMVFDTDKLNMNNYRKADDKESWMIKNDAKDQNLNRVILPESIEIDFSDRIVSINF